MAETKPNHIIVQFESDDFYITVADLILSDAGLGIAAKAKNKAQASKLVGDIADGKLKPDIAIVDSMIEDNHTEGEKIATRLKELVPGIKIIAYSIIDDQPWADYMAVKSNLDPTKTLIKGLSELLKIDFHSDGGNDPT